MNPQRNQQAWPGVEHLVTLSAGLWRHPNLSCLRADPSELQSRLQSPDPGTGSHSFALPLYGRKQSCQRASWLITPSSSESSVGTWFWGPCFSATAASWMVSSFAVTALCRDYHKSAVWKEGSSQSVSFFSKQLLTAAVCHFYTEQERDRQAFTELSCTTSPLLRLCCLLPPGGVRSSHCP